MEKLSTIIFQIKAKTLGVRVGVNPKVRGSFHIIKHPGSIIEIGNNFNASIITRHGANRIKTYSSNSKVTIGNNTGVTDLSIDCRSTEIRIGNNVMLASYCRILDTDFHCIEPNKRNQPCFERDKPVIIEDNVWIGTNCIILKGVVIGKSSIVGAGSVVTKDVAPYSIYAGNPACFKRKIQDGGKGTASIAGGFNE